MGIRTRYKVAAVAVVAARVLLELDSSYALNQSCEPQSSYARLSEVIKGRHFWLQQLEDIEDEIRVQRDVIKTLQELPQRQEAIRREVQPQVSAMLAALPPPTPAHAYAQQLRQRADAIDQQDALNTNIARASQQIQAAFVCKSTIQARLNEAGSK